MRDTLFRDLKSANEADRLRALYLLGRLGEPGAISHIQQVAASDPAPEIRTAAQAAIQYIQKTQQLDTATDIIADAQWKEQFTAFIRNTPRFATLDIEALIAEPPRPEPASATKDSSARPSTTESVYEMLWDCEFCGTTKLLGVTHRFCPNCGAAQDPNARYFPQPGEEIAIENHDYYGVDVICPACETPNSASAKFCKECGADLATGEKAALRADDTQGTQKRDVVKEQFEADLARAKVGTASPQRQTKKSRRALTWGAIISSLLILIGAIFGIFFLRLPEEATVTGHSWELSYEIQRYSAVQEHRDCDSRRDVPSGAYDVTTRTEQRSRRVPDGEDCREQCTSKRVDQGDGSFKRVEDCKTVCETRYRTENYNVTVCYYSVNRWREIDTPGWAKSSGTGTTPEWPDVSQYRSCNSTSGTSLGDICWDDRQAAYIVHLERDSGGDVECEFDSEKEWLSYQDGQRVEVNFTLFSRLRNTALCDEMEVIN